MGGAVWLAGHPLFRPLFIAATMENLAQPLCPGSVVSLAGHGGTGHLCLGDLRPALPRLRRLLGQPPDTLHAAGPADHEIAL